MAEPPIEGMNSVAWLRETRPFPHIVARNVFQPDFYRGMDRQFQEMLDRGLSEVPASGQFMRMTSYDAYGVSFDHSLTGNLRVFTSLAWHNWMTGLFHVQGTGQIYAGAHHHKAGSASGMIHNDYNSAWFPAAETGEIRFPDHFRCAYKTGAGPLAPAERVRVFRAVAMIFYLHNDGWEEGAGGETGLFKSRKDPIDQPHARIAPINNSMLLFECRPRSYHAFLHNPGGPRNSIVMWAHRTLEDALSHWPANAEERWREVAGPKPF
jgi:2OG-Fe(II) oxygenase superfamily